jgi:hypothetical protein
MEWKIQDEVRAPTAEVASAFYGYLRVREARAEEITVTFAHHATLAGMDEAHQIISRMIRLFR